jgi:hypothetical protein
MAQLKSGTRIYGTATIDTSVVVGSAVTLSSSGINANNTNTAQLNVSGVSTLGGVKISSGIVTASSGIITYYGDGSRLTGIEAETDQFNTGVTNNLSSTLVGIGSTVLTFPATSGKQYVIHSINVSNVATGNTEVNVIGSFDFTASERSYFAYNVPIPTGTSLELLKQPQVMNPSDRITMRSTDYTRTGADNIIEAYITYQEKTDTFYSGVGLGAVGLAVTNPITVYTSTTYPSVVQSVRLVNRTDSGAYPISVLITNGVTTTRIVDNLIVPKYSTVELLDGIKRIDVNGTVKVQLNQGSTIDVQVSAKKIRATI